MVLGVAHRILNSLNRYIPQKSLIFCLRVIKAATVSWHDQQRAGQRVPHIHLVPKEKEKAEQCVCVRVQQLTAPSRNSPVNELKMTEEKVAVSPCQAGQKSIW